MSRGRTETTVNEIYDGNDFQPLSSVGYLVNRVRTEFLGALDRELAPYDVTSAQYIIMAHLYYAMADSASGLCKGIAYDPGAMTRMMDRLEAKGLVRRARTAEDRRAVKLELTDEGKLLFPKLRDRVLAVLNHFMRDFTKSEARQLEGFLQRMLANA